MAVRTLTLTKSKLTETGLAVLDFGYWSGKPEDLGDQITVPVWRDSDYGHSVFQLSVHPPGKIYDIEEWTIDERDLELLRDLEVNEWWNKLAEAILVRVDRENLLLTLPDHLSRLPTQSYRRAIHTPI